MAQNRREISPANAASPQRARPSMISSVDGAQMGPRQYPSGR